MLVVNNLSYKIKDKNLLINLSFEAHKGEVLCVLGANGAGKSTLLKILTGELKAQLGEILYNNTAIQQIPTSEFACKRAVLAQSVNVNLQFTVFEIVMMGRYPHFKNTPTTNDLLIVQECMQEVQIEHLKERDITTLSGGEQQRVHLARVLAQIWEKSNEPLFLFLDEPVSSLDILHQHKLLEIVQKLKQKGYVIIAILHDLNLASQYADKVLLLSKGNIIAFGDTHKVLNEKNIWDTFQINVNIIHHQGCEFPFVIPAISTQLEVV